METKWYGVAGWFETPKYFATPEDAEAALGVGLRVAGEAPHRQAVLRKPARVAEYDLEEGELILQEYPVED